MVRFVYRSPQFKARYNIAPRSFVPVLVLENETVLKSMRWGLIPPWAKDEAIGDKMINARAETLTEKASFKKPFQTQRCLVPATGYFEWQRTGAGKIPFQFSMADDRFFCIAGLWERWTRPHRDGELGLDDSGPGLNQVVESFTIITTEPNSIAAQVHDRMPVIVDQEHYSRWLEPESSEESLKTLFKPYPTEKMQVHRVSAVVNNARKDGPECIKPA